MPVKIANRKTQNSKVAKDLLSVPVYSLDGKAAGEMDLPKELFGVEVNKKLLNQALRVYLNNQVSHHSHTKTRSEVVGSTRKIYRQKGTGGARHGSIRAPIFVGGGIALGPKSRNVTLNLPQKMRRAALVSALSLKANLGDVLGVKSLDKLSGKTSQVAKLLQALNITSALIITADKNELVSRSVRNLPSILALTTNNINVLELIKHQKLIVDQTAFSKISTTKIGKTT